MSEPTGPTGTTEAPEAVQSVDPSGSAAVEAVEEETVEAHAEPADTEAADTEAVEAVETEAAETEAAEAPATEGVEAPATEGVEAPATEGVEAPAEQAAEAPATEAAEAPAVSEAVETEAAEAPAEAPTVPAPAASAGPRPSPAVLAAIARPAAPPAAATPPVLAAEPAEPAEPSDSERFGRVDADGTVHVQLAEGGEAAVGQWAAGTPAEGLAFFARKYDDLSVEVDLATRRLGEGKSSPDQAATVVKRARESLASPSMVGDLASLTARVDALDALVAERKAVVAAERAAARAEALAVREAIVVEAEALAESTQWKATGERFKELLEQWKNAPRADRGGEQALWKRFSHARSQFDKHRRQYFARLDHERGEAKQVKEALVAEAEALQASTDWGATAGAYRDLMTRWKAAGRAGKTDEEALWSRFRTAQDAFFSKRNAAFGERDAGFAENLAAKEALVAEAEALDLSDLKAAKSALRGIQERWEKIGHVPRGDKDRIEGRLRKVEEGLRRGEQEQWRRTNPEGRARASATVAQFQGSLDKLRADLEKATAAGDARKVADLEGRIATTESLLEAAQRAADEFSG